MAFLFNKKLVKYFRKYIQSRPYLELTEIEKIILQKISYGKSYYDVASDLSISKEEVQRIIRNIYEKLQVKRLS